MGLRVCSGNCRHVAADEPGAATGVLLPNRPPARSATGRTAGPVAPVAGVAPVAAFRRTVVRVGTPTPGGARVLVLQPRGADDDLARGARPFDPHSRQVAGSGDGRRPATGPQCARGPAAHAAGQRARQPRRSRAMVGRGSRRWPVALGLGPAASRRTGRGHGPTGPRRRGLPRGHTVRADPALIAQLARIGKQPQPVGPLGQHRTPSRGRPRDAAADPHRGDPPA